MDEPRSRGRQNENEEDEPTVILRRAIIEPDEPLTPSSPSSPSAPAFPSSPSEPAPPEPASSELSQASTPGSSTNPAPLNPSDPDAWATLAAAAGRRRSESLDEPEAGPSKPAPANGPESPTDQSLASHDQKNAPRHGIAGDQPGPTAATDSSHGPARALVIIAVVVVVALAIATVLFFVPTTPAPPTEPSPVPAPDPLVATTDLAALNQGAWTQAPTTPGPADVICFGDTASATATPQADVRQSSRAFVPQASPTSTDAVTQVLSTYSDDASATKSYVSAQAITGTCPDKTGQILSSFEVSGLADAATGSVILAEGPTAAYHTLLVTRTGRVVSVVDVTTSAQASPASVVSAISAGLARLCTGGEGMCPSTPAVTRIVPPAGSEPGWLLPADLPQLTPGAGRWSGGLRDPVTVQGSQCEGTSLTKVSGTTSTQQWTLVLTDDPSQPRGFGIDQVVYTFPAAKNATALVKTLTKNINGCAKTMLIASVKKGAAIKGTGANNLAFTGSTFTVTHTIEGTQQRIFRVSVIQVGPKVGYLIAPVTPSFDFTDDQWNALTTRGGERMSQV